MVTSYIYKTNIILLNYIRLARSIRFALASIKMRTSFFARCSPISETHSILFFNDANTADSEANSEYLWQNRKGRAMVVGGGLVSNQPSISPAPSPTPTSLPTANPTAPAGWALKPGLSTSECVIDGLCVSRTAAPYAANESCEWTALETGEVRFTRLATASGDKVYIPQGTGG